MQRFRITAAGVDFDIEIDFETEAEVWTKNDAERLKFIHASGVFRTLSDGSLAFYPPNSIQRIVAVKES